MQLPHVLKTRHMMQSLVCGQCAAFLQPIVHQGNTRRECRKDGRTGIVPAAMMCHHICIDCTDKTVGTSQIEQRLTAQVSHIQEAKMTKLNQDTSRSRILDGVIRGQCRGSTGTVDMPRA